MRLTSKVTCGSAMPDFPIEVVKNEPMLFSCDIATARRKGGPITKSFLHALSQTPWGRDKGVVVDSRVHMLMPGWWPCIPGWHHDDVPRSRADGQPNYDTPEYKAEHVMAIVGDAECRTEFAVGTADLPDVPHGKVIYGEWHPYVDALVDAGMLHAWKPPKNRLVFFDWLSLHQGTQALTGGWRWFIRASRNTARKPTNELRRQVQVYLARPMGGW